MKITTLIGTAMLLVLAPTAAMATDIDSVANATSSIGNFGSPNTATYGQTFTAAAGDTFLNSFSMFLNGTNGALTFRGYLATWDGSKAGTLLYSSADRMLNSTAAKQEYFFAPATALTVGQQYVAFLSTSQVTNGNVATTMPISFTSVIPNGEFVYMNNGTGFGNLFSGSWTRVAGADVAFKADFSNGATAVPEPAAWAMLILGVAAIGGAMRVRRRTARVHLA